MKYSLCRHFCVYFSPEKERMWGVWLLDAEQKWKDPMKELESNLSDDLLSLWLRATGSTAQSILDDPKYKSIPVTARSTIQRMIDFWELDVSFSLSRNLWDTGRLNMIKRVINDGFRWRDSIIIFDSGGGTNYDVKTVGEYNSLVSRDIRNFNKNVFISIFRTPENLNKYVGTISTKNWSELWMYFQSRGWESQLLNGVNKTLYKTFFTELAEKKKNQEREKIDPLFAEMRKSFSWSPQVIRSIELFAKEIGIEFWADGNVDMNKILSKIIGKKELEWKTDTDALKHLTSELSELRKKVDEISKSIKSERHELLLSLGWPDITIGRFSEMSGVNTTTRWADGKEKDIRNTAIVSLTKVEANTLLTNISSAINTKNISPRIAKLIILLWLQVRYGEMAQAKWSIHATQKEIHGNPSVIKKSPEGKRTISLSENSQKTIDFAGTISAQSQVLSDTKDLTKEMKDETESLSDAQAALKKLRETGVKTQAQKEKEARLKAYIEQNIALAQTYNTVKTEYGEKWAQEFFQQYYEIGRGKALDPWEHIHYKSLETIATLTDPEIPWGTKLLAWIPVGWYTNMSELFRVEGISQSAPELTSISIMKNSDWTYDIPTFGAKNLSEKQVNEAKNQMKIYTDLGLSQFIPHIPLIIGKMKGEGIGVEIDGRESNTEQEYIIKYFYRKLFEKKDEILPESVPEMMQRFRHALWNPTNMRWAMQRVLKMHNLIPEANRQVSQESMTIWLWKNRKDRVSLDDRIAFV